MASERAHRPKILFIVAEDWFFVSHFLGMARAAIADGFDVAVIANVGASRAAIEAAGCRLIGVPVARHALGLTSALAALWHYRAIIRAERPAIVHCIALKSIVLGGFAARLAGAPRLVLAPTGLGFLWTARGVKPALGRAAVRLATRALLLGRATRCLFENRDNPRSLGLDPDDARKCVYVGGAGVSPREFPAQEPPPPGPVRVAVVARMLRAKGIPESVEALRAARASGADVCLNLWGEPDPVNPGSCTIAELESYASEAGVAWRGRTVDVPGVWKESAIAMLLSHAGEGLPRSLVEAAASGRPIVTTDAPGCRDVVTDGVEGFVVAIGDSASAGRALARLAADSDLRAVMGKAARARFECEFAEDVVNAKVVALYRALMAGAPGA